MRKLIVLIGIFSMLFAGPLTGFAQQDYEKYGRIATAVIREDYAGQELVEYQYEGRQQKSQDEVTDTFRFEVMENNRPIFVRVIITHNLRNNKLLNLSVTEEQRSK